GRVVGPDRLDRELPELAEVAPLRGRVAVHLPERVELDRLRLAVQAVLEVGACDRRGRLRAQRQGAATLVLEGVHLLVHDVRPRAGGALEERGVLEDRRLDRSVAVERAEV